MEGAQWPSGAQRQRGLSEARRTSKSPACPRTPGSGSLIDCALPPRVWQGEREGKQRPLAACARSFPSLIRTPAVRVRRSPLQPEWTADRNEGGLL